MAAIGSKAVVRATEARMFIKGVIDLFLFEGVRSLASSARASRHIPRAELIYSGFGFFS